MHQSNTNDKDIKFMAGNDVTMPNGVPKNTIKEMKDSDAKLELIVEYVAATNSKIVEYVAATNSKIDGLNAKLENIEAKRNTFNEKQNKGCDARYEKCDCRFRKLEKIGYGVGGVVVLSSIAVPIIVAWISG